MDPTALYYALSTIAQCAAALAALIGFFGVWRLDRHREEVSRLEQEIVRVTILSTQDSPTKAQLRGREYYLKKGRELTKPGHTELTPLYAQLDALPDARRLTCTLSRFLRRTLLILVLAIIGLIFADVLYAWVLTRWIAWLLIILASISLYRRTISVVHEAVRSTRALLILATLLILANPVWPSTATADKAFLCAVDTATGFAFDKSRQQWGSVWFKAESKYVVSKATTGEHVWKVKEVGEEFAFILCSQDFNEFGFLFCEGIGEFRMNKHTLRFLYIYPVGYWNSAPEGAPDQGGREKLL